MARFTRADYGATLGWQVGIYSWLNSHDSRVARYWRSIEMGDSSLVGKRVVGLWGPPDQAGTRSWFDRAPGDTLDVYGISGTSRNLHAAYRAAMADYFFNGYGANMSQIRVRDTKGDPEVQRRRVYYWMVHIAKPDQWYFASGVIRNPMPARGFYRKTLRAFNPVEAELVAMRRAFKMREGANRGTITTTMRSRIKSKSTGPPRSFTSNAAPYFGAAAMAVTASATLQDLTRSGSFFTSLQGEIRRINAEVARRFQDELVQQMRSGLRTQSGSLLKAHGSPNNRYPR